MLGKATGMTMFMPMAAFGALAMEAAGGRDRRLQGRGTKEQRWAYLPDMLAWIGEA